MDETSATPDVPRRTYLAILQRFVAALIVV